MYKTQRYHQGTLDYWNKRWDKIGVDSNELNLDKYPGKFADQAILMAGAPVLEAGCGLGRVFFKYYGKIDITAFDFSSVCIEKIKVFKPTAPVYQADILSLPFEDNKFKTVLAFGLYHNFEDITVIKDALLETKRVMQKGGVLCVSFRLDSLVNRVNDYLQIQKYKNVEYQKKVFHKLNLKKSEFSIILNEAGFRILKLEYTENMPLLYKLRFFRHKTHKSFDEKKGRAEGYRLSFLGATLNKIIKLMLSKQSCNLMVVYAQKI